MTDLFADSLPIPLEAQIEEVEREVRMRQRVYPSWIVSGRLSATEADRQIHVMCAVLKTLRELKARTNAP